VLATDVRHLELGIACALTAGLAILALPTSIAPSAPGMPAPTPEIVHVRDAKTATIDCAEPGITTVVFRGTVHAIDPDMRATFHFRFADLPSRYSVMTGANGGFEIRIPRDELGYLDLCELPSSGQRPALFHDAQMTISYELAFER